MKDFLYHTVLTLWTLYFVGSTASRDDVSLSNSTIFGFKGMFCLFLKWKPPIANCTIRYKKEMQIFKGGSKKKDSGLRPQWELKIIDTEEGTLNGNLNFSMKAECSNQTVETLEKTLELTPGDEKTAVTDFRCVWHYQEHVKCTWRPGQNTPRDVKYRILYWINENTTNSSRLYPLDELWDLLETGKTCDVCTPPESQTVGCQFEINKSVKDLVLMAIVITDTRRTIKPLIQYISANDIVKLKPPQAVEAVRNPNNTIYIRSNNTLDFQTEQQYLLTSTRSENGTLMGGSITIPNSQPDVTYRIKVRVKPTSVWLTDKTNSNWSDWSKEIKLEGTGEKRLTSLILPLIISALVIIGAVLLLVHMGRIKALMCPQIPDPARIFPKDLQKWLANDVNIVYSKPEKEDICPVHVVENPPPTKCV